MILTLHNMKHSFLVLLAMTLSSTVMLSCSTSEPKNGNEEIPVESKGAYKHVIIIGVDGGGAFFSRTTTPNTYEITGQGAFSY